MIVKTTLATLAVLAVAGQSGCGDAQTDQARRAAEAARSINFTDNAEIDNIKKRLEITSKPGVMGFIILLNESGQPILYEGVIGKVTSGGKRLTRPDVPYAGASNTVVRQNSSDEGTYGTSSNYIFYWNTNGAYRQWSGQYLYSDKPFRLNVQPLAVTLESK